MGLVAFLIALVVFQGLLSVEKEKLGHGEVNEVIVVTAKLFVTTEQGQLNVLSLLNMVTGVRAQRSSW